jgi:hypothetical protein
VTAEIEAGIDRTRCPILGFEREHDISMREGTRLALDILISAVFAVFSAAVGFLIGLLLSWLSAPVIFRVLFPDSESPVRGLIPLGIMAVPTFLGGVFGFPLCGIWLAHRRQAFRSNSLQTQR